MRTAKHAARGSFRPLERIHGQAEIVERGGRVLVSKGWRAALRRHAAALKTRHDALSPVADDLAWNLEFMNEVRFDHFGPRDDSESDSDDGPVHDYVVNDPRLIIHS